jgi:hypothetical protein
LCRYFAAALAAEDDYDAATLEKARNLLVNQTFGGAAQELIPAVDT